MKQVLIAKTSHKGYGVFATTDIPKDTAIASFNGDIYTAESAMLLPKIIRDLVVQFSPTQYRASNNIAHLLNHSCNPNCGIEDLFTLVTMRDIAAGEELTWDYEMTEESDWTLQCRCREPNCRKIIGAYSRLPQEQKARYGRYVSRWLRDIRTI